MPRIIASFILCLLHHVFYTYQSKVENQHNCLKNLSTETQSSVRLNNYTHLSLNNKALPQIVVPKYLTKEHQNILKMPA